MKRISLPAGLLLLFTAEILRIYFVTPLPGSQHKNTIALAFWIGNNITWIRIVALALIIFPLINIFKSGKVWAKIALSLTLALYATIFFFANYRFEASKMFVQPTKKVFTAANADTTDKDKLVIGVFINGEAKAYPIQIIGYHHFIMDTVGNKPVMVTYCTVCRTARVYSPIINGEKPSFRLVGIDKFNAVLEDETTGTWWQQATGKAVAGPLKGSVVNEIPYKQLTLATWLREYPRSLVMQPDIAFNKNYNDLAGYDKGNVISTLQKRDSASWKSKSWVVGVTNNQVAKAYDWNELVEEKFINDTVDGLPVLVALENDEASFHVYNRELNGKTLHFEKRDEDLFIDRNTQSTWNMDGVCISGSLKGQRLSIVQSSQEFWHSWSTFHPNTSKYNSSYTAHQIKKSFYDYL